MTLTGSGVYRFFTTPISDLLAYWFHTEVVPVIPSKWKRIFLVASIIAMTSFTDKPDFALFEKINRLLKLKYQGRSYWIPKSFRNMIWRSILRDQIELNGKIVPVTNLDQFAIDRDELDVICRFFVDRTPPWLVYDSRTKIHKDLEHCLITLFNKRFDTNLA